MQFLERVSKIGSASNQVLAFWAVERLSFCHEDAAVWKQMDRTERAKFP
jgi:hypothetical protein